MGIKKLCLIRSPATTHTFDENQLYVPLNFTVASNPSRLLATSPASPDSAPPGYYMLFVVGSHDGTEVPSIAKWVRLGPAGRDTCDSVRPQTMNYFAVDAVTQTSAYLSWTATGDDTSLVASGPVKEFDLRRKLSSMLTETAWAGGTALSGEPTPGPAGTAHYHTATGLTANTTYYFAIRAKDDNYPGTPLSGLHGSVWATTSGGGGGGMSAQVAPAGSETMNRGAIVFGAVGHGSSGSGAMVVLTDRTQGAGWRVRLTRVAADEEGGVDGIRMGDVVGGSWSSERVVRPDLSDDGFGLCRLVDRGRTEFPRDYAPEQLATEFDRGARFVLSSAIHSTLGEVPIERLGDTAIATGDTLTITYDPAAEPGAGSGGWYVMLRRTSGQPAARLQRDMTGRPLRHALYQSQPNPTRGSSLIRFDLAEPGHAVIEVHDLQGRLVRTLVSARLDAGRHSTEWDGRDQSGRALAAGVYAYRLKLGQTEFRRKMTLIR